MNKSYYFIDRKIKTNNKKTLQQQDCYKAIISYKYLHFKDNKLSKWKYTILF